MCLSNNKNTALVNGGLAPRLPYNFPEVPEAHFAEQLTRMDMVSSSRSEANRCQTFYC